MSTRVLEPPIRSTGPDRPRSEHGTRPPTVSLRELHDGEVEVLDGVFAGLSPESRRLRFHGATPRLTTTVRHALTAVDGQRHIAVAAFGPDGRPIGIARLVRLAEQCADLAVEVVDAWQGQGIGRRLLADVARRGYAAGYTCLVAETLTENTAMSVLLASTLPLTSWVTAGFETTLTADLRPLSLDGTPACPTGCRHERRPVQDMGNTPRRIDFRGARS
jgi:GNAT superfamily N-acetyltransferase